MNNIIYHAIIFANGEPCSQELVQRIFKRYADAKKIVLDGAILHISAYDIVPDLWLGDFDHNLNEKHILQHYPNLEVIHTPDQEYTDLEKALFWLQNHNCKNVHILWATGKRLDHTVNNLFNLARFRTVFDTITLYDDYSVCMPLPQQFEQYFTQGTVISLVPVGSVSGIITENLKYSLNDEMLCLGYRNGTSNEVLQDGLVRIMYKSGDLLLILENKTIFSG